MMLIRTVLVAAAFASVVASSGCTAKEPAPSPSSEQNAARNAAARALLRSYVDTLRGIVTIGSPEFGREALDELAAELDSTYAGDALPAMFRSGYVRLVSLSRAVMRPPTDTAARAQVDRELAALAKDVGAGSLSLDGGLAAVSAAFADEVVRLHLLVEPGSTADNVRPLYFPDEP